MTCIQFASSFLFLFISSFVFPFTAQLCPNSGVKRMVSESGDLIPLKRERFTFKAAHLAVLERYYEKDPYPDSQTREQIVDECNKAVERAGINTLLDI